MRVKVCGITTPEDAALAADLGAFAIGLVFWPLSPRCVAREVARRVVQALPAGVESIGVFVDQSPADVRAIADEVGLTAVQLHGGERVTEYERSARLVVKAVAMRGGDDVRTAVELPAPVLALLDAHDPVRRGGTGQTIDWTLASEVARVRPVVLSGGLRPENVAAAGRAVRPYAMDVSSGVEAAPGRKDPAKLRAFFAAVRSI